MSEELNVTDAGQDTAPPAVDIPADNTPSPEPTPQADPNRSTRQDIEAAMDEVEKKRGNPYKDPNTGKFTNKPAEEAQKSAAPAGPTNPEADATPAPAQHPVLAMPKSWAKENQALWDTLPAAAKEVVLAREDQAEKGFEKYRPIAERYKALDEVLSPLDSQLPQGVTREAFVKQLIDWNQALANNPQAAFPALMQAFGYQLPQSGSQQPTDPNQQPQYYIPPQLEQLPQQFAQVTNQLQETRSQLDAIRHEQTNKEIAAFAAQPEHKHFERLRVPMGNYIKAIAASEGRVPDLKEAYDFAFRSDAELFNAHMKSEFEKTIQKQKDDAEKARRAREASLVGRSPAGANLNGTANSDGSVRGDIMAAFGEVGGRA